MDLFLNYAIHSGVKCTFTGFRLGSNMGQEARINVKVVKLDFLCRVLHETLMV